MRVPSDQEVLTKTSGAEGDEAASRCTPMLKKEHDTAISLQFNTQAVPPELRSAKAWVVWGEEAQRDEEGAR